MIHRKPVDYPEAYRPSQHRWLAERWDKQNRVPENATQQAYDVDRRVLIFMLDGEQHEIVVLTPPTWAGKTPDRKKRLKEDNK